MSAQDNLDRALESGTATLRTLCLASEVDGYLLEDKPTKTLQAMLHDLDSIVMALNEEVNGRPETNQPQDWG